MKYMTTKETSEKWGISDRRVRVLCKEGRIPGVIEVKGSYLVPYDAVRPSDRRYRKSAEQYISYYGYGNAVSERPAVYTGGRIILYLKWGDEIIGHVFEDHSVFFIRPCFNKVIERYTAGRDLWTREQFEAFLQERIVSRERRDIERILFRCGLSSYDTIRVGIATKAVNASDLIWLTADPSEKMSDAVSDVFSSVFLQKVDAQGDSIDTPEGVNIKRYGVYAGHYGIYKKRLSPVTADVEAEMAVFRLAQLMNVPCCRAYRVDEDTVFSVFEYDFAREFIVHVRRLYQDAARGDNEFFNLLSVRPQYQADIVRMIALDFVTRQDDRHLSNIAVKMSDEGESFYPLYDNGRSLFYEDTEETARRACEDVRLFSTAFGPSGTYYDYVRDISAGGIVFSRLMDLNIDEEDIRKALTDSGFTGYRLEASRVWIHRTLEILRKLDEGSYDSSVF